MELISPRPLTGGQELKQELFLRAEELERLVAIYKLNLCGDERNSLNYGTNQLLDKRFTEVLEEQRGQFYDLYMRKRELKIREEWQAKGAKKEAEMRTMMESLASTSSRMMRKGKVTEPRNEYSRQTSSKKSSSSSSVASSTSQSSATSVLHPTIRSTNLASLSKVDTKPLKGTCKDTTLQKTIARSKSSSDRMCLAKGIRASRSQSLRKNSASLGEQKDFMLMNPDPDSLISPVHNNLSRNGATDPLMMKNIGRGVTAGLSRTKLRVSMASLEEDQVVESGEILKEGNGDFKSVYDPSIGGSHNMDQYMDGKTDRVRKKWGSVERPFQINRFLRFGGKNRGVEVRNDKDDDNDLENYSFEDLNSSRMGHISSFDSFNEHEVLHEKVNSPHNPNRSANLKERNKHPLENYPKADRSVFSLPSFHGRKK